MSNAMEKVFEGLNELYAERDSYERGSAEYKLASKQLILIGAAYDACYGIGFDDESMLNPEGAAALEVSYQRVLNRKPSTRNE